MNLETQRPSEVGELEELTFDNNIHTGNANRSTNRLIKGLRDLDVQLTQPAEIYIENLPSSKSKQLGEDHFQRTMSLSISTTEVPHSIGLPTNGSFDLVRDDSLLTAMNSNYYVHAHMHLDGQPFRIAMFVEPKGNEPYKVDLVMPTSLQLNKGMLLESLTPNFTTIGFIHDLAHRPQHRDRLSAIAQKRIPAQVLEGSRGRRSSVKGHETPEGFNTNVDLYVQSPNSEDFLKCYEVELFSKDGKKNPENTTEIAPESVWQEKENHFCIIGAVNTSFPLVPVGIDKIARLTMRIHSQSASDTASELLGDLPISIDGTNQRYATGYLEDGNVELLFKPEWGKNNAALVYRKTSSKRISAKEIRDAVVGLSSLKNDIMQRLAA